MPDRPVGTKSYRVTKAIHWHYVTEKTHEEIADELGVSAETVKDYLDEPPSEEVESQLADQQREVRLVAYEELKYQLQAAGEASRTAETPVKVWQDEDGNVRVNDIHDDEGELVSKKPVPVDIEMGPDDTARYFRREEVREILDRLVDLVGAAEPEQHKVEHSGEVDGDFSINITHHRVTEDETDE